MKCPYCSNDINSDSTKCEICGVDLTYQLDIKKKNTLCILFLWV